MADGADHDGGPLGVCLMVPCGDFVAGRYVRRQQFEARSILNDAFEQESLRRRGRAAGLGGERITLPAHDACDFRPAVRVSDYYGGGEWTEALAARNAPRRALL
ncbi:MAG TPA: hypothetical protein VJ924_05460 [Alphaproteobacteria bacterium]|nr:hypothetical protein [Alphaproteobacteria bacterium]